MPYHESGEFYMCADENLNTLRRDAEKRLYLQIPALLEKVEEFSIPEIQRILNELRVHQIELDMQNEELRRTQLELLISQERYFDLYELAPVGYFSLNRQGMILGVNLTGVKSLHLEKKDVLKRPFSRYIVSEDQDAFYLFTQRLFSQKSVQQCEVRVRPAMSDPIWVQLEGNLIREPQNGEPLLRMTVSNIQAQKEAQTALQKSNRTLEQTILELTEMRNLVEKRERLAVIGQLAAGIAHDFRNLLTTMNLQTTLARNSPDLDPMVVRRLGIVLAESDKAGQLVQKILDFSRQSHLTLKTLDLATLVEGVLRILTRILRETIHLSFQVEGGANQRGLSETAWLIQADAGRLEQVLMNLALNAQDAMPQGGTMEVRLERFVLAPAVAPPVTGMEPGDWIALTVLDTGTGMTPEVLSHLYEPFYTTKEVGKGTGLGLAQSYGIIKQHLGHMAVESEVNVGTSVCLYLPTAIGPAEAEILPMEETPQGQGETILLVEDNSALLQVEQEMLESLGYRILPAANGLVALTLYQTHPEIALVVTDLTMPDMDGATLAGRLNAIQPTLKVLGVTGYSLAEVTSKLGFWRIIRKPFEMAELTQHIRQALDATD